MSTEIIQHMVKKTQRNQWAFVDRWRLRQ